MKIRTITTGFTLKLPLQEKQIMEIGAFTIRAKREFQKRGYVVQTIRTATQPWEEYFKSGKQILSLVKELENLIQKL